MDISATIYSCLVVAVAWYFFSMSEIFTKGLNYKKLMTTPVQVFCRVRPSSQDSVEGLKVIENSSRIILPSPRNHLDAITYSFNRVFGPDSNEKDIWQACKPTILDSLKGKNSSIFAYGQTGSGKTHTMLSCQGSVVQSTILELLNHKNVSLTASYIEIYNEKIFDLLSGSETCLELRQNGMRPIRPL